MDRANISISKPTFIKVVDLQGDTNQINIDLISSHRQGSTNAFINAGGQIISVSAADYQDFLERLGKVSFVI